jgi:hypothetical protein
MDPKEMAPKPQIHDRSQQLAISMCFFVCLSNEWAASQAAKRFNPLPMSYTQITFKIEHAISQW